jgi:hypothetical protein
VFESYGSIILQERELEILECPSKLPSHMGPFEEKPHLLAHYWERQGGANLKEFCPERLRELLLLLGRDGSGCALAQVLRDHFESIPFHAHFVHLYRFAVLLIRFYDGFTIHLL